MPRRKKKYMLLRGRFGTFIIVEREWYDHTGGRKDRMWKIVLESDDREMLQAMAGLTGMYVKTELKISTEGEVK